MLFRSSVVAWGAECLLAASLAVALVATAQAPQHLAESAAATPATPRAPIDITDALRIHYVGYAVGTERYTLVGANDGLLLTADLDYSDRGRRTHLVSTSRMRADFTPTRLEITRLTDSTTRVPTRSASVRTSSCSLRIRSSASRISVRCRW